MHNKILANIVSSIEKYSRNYKNGAKPCFKPSMMICERECFYMFKGIPAEETTFDYQAIGVMESGSDRHKRLQKAILRADKTHFISVKKHIAEKNLGYLHEITQFSNGTLLFDTRYNMRFVIDGLIEFEGNRYVLEIKTESSNMFDKHNDVWEEHTNQATCYGVALDIRNVLFLYENRDTLELKMMPLEIKQEMKDNMYQFIKNVENSVATNDVPAKTNSRRHCNWCVYQNICKKEGS